jgi:hypothetical protein
LAKAIKIILLSRKKVAEENKLKAVANVLEKELIAGSYIKSLLCEQRWWLHDEDGNGIVSGETVLELLQNLKKEREK